MMAQAIALAKRPHIVVGTPGRLVDHLSNTKGFSLRTIKYLVSCLESVFLSWGAIDDCRGFCILLLRYAFHACVWEKSLHAEGDGSFSS